MELKDFKPGDQIVYIPDHADGSGHPDCEKGFITSVTDKYVFCRYWSQHDENELRTLANSESTPHRCLIKLATKPQKLINELVERFKIKIIPRRILIEEHYAVPPHMTKIKPDIIFIKQDGWSLGAPKKFEYSAYLMWSDEWAYFAEGPDFIKKPIADYKIPGWGI